MRQYVNFADKGHLESFEVTLKEIVKAGARKKKSPRVTTVYRWM